MTQDETNVMVLFILLGIIWSVLRNAIEKISSKSDRAGRSSASLIRQSQALAETSSGRNLASGIGDIAADAVRDLEFIRRVDPTFDARQFLDRGRLVYEAIVQAFATGDKELLRELVSEEVYNVFLETIQAREQRGEYVDLTVICIEKAEISKVSLFNRQAQIMLRFAAQLVTATRAGNGIVVAGDPNKIVTVRDLWTFACELTSKAPAWKLVATDAV